MVITADSAHSCCPAPSPLGYAQAVELRGRRAVAVLATAQSTAGPAWSARSTPAPVSLVMVALVYLPVCKDLVQGPADQQHGRESTRAAHPGGPRPGLTSRVPPSSSVSGTIPGVPPGGVAHSGGSAVLLLCSPPPCSWPVPCRSPQCTHVPGGRRTTLPRWAWEAQMASAHIQDLCLLLWEAVWALRGSGLAGAGGVTQRRAKWKLCVCPSASCTDLARKS